EISFNHALVFDATVNNRRGVDLVIEHDGHLAMEVLLGERTKALRSIAGQREIDLILAGVVHAAIFDRVTQIAAGQDGSAAEDVPDFSAFGTAACRAVLRTARYEFRTGWKHAAMRSERGCL